MNYYIAGGLSKLLLNSEHQLALGPELSDHLEIPFSDSRLKPETVKAIIGKRPNLLHKAIGESPHHEIIELVFDNPTVQNIKAALNNSRLTDDQHARISALYDENPRKSLIVPLLSYNGPLLANISPEEVADIYIETMSKGRHSYYNEPSLYYTISRRGELKREVASILLVRAAEGATKVENIHNWVVAARPEALDQYVEIRLQAGESLRPLAHLNQLLSGFDWKADRRRTKEVVRGILRGGVEEEQRHRVVRVATTVVTAAEKGGLTEDEIMEILSEVAAEEGFHNISQVINATRQRADLSQLSPFDVACWLPHLVRSGHYERDAFEAAGVDSGLTERVIAAESEDPEAVRMGDIQALQAVVAGRPCNAKQLERLQRHYQEGSLSELLGELEVEDAMRSLTYSRTIQFGAGEEVDLSKMVEEYVLSQLGGDVSRWRNFSTLSEKNPKFKVNEILAIID